MFAITLSTASVYMPKNHENWLAVDKVKLQK